MDCVRVGTAGWSIPRAIGEALPGAGRHLDRYARVLPCAEINSSFHRPHAPAVYARWAAATPPGFRFSVKLPKAITHVLKLRRTRAPLEEFLQQSAELGDRRGPLLVQLPPSLAFDLRAVSRFFDLLRSLHDGDVVCEPRHASWFTGRVDRVLSDHRVARVAADPAPAPGAAVPGGWGGLVYYRMHGSPRKYFSAYGPADIEHLAGALRGVAPGVAAWCVFDNTASGAALANALELNDALARS